MKLKDKPKPPKKVNTGSTKLSLFNHYTALLEEESDDHQHEDGPENTPKHSPIYITDVGNYSMV
jgi:hypothetical protein